MSRAENLPFLGTTTGVDLHLDWRKCVFCAVALLLLSVTIFSVYSSSASYGTGPAQQQSAFNFVHLNGAPVTKECVYSPTTAEVKRGGNVIVWDGDAPCDSGECYIHNADGHAAKMTAGAGPNTHIYYAKTFNDSMVKYYGKAVGRCTTCPSTNGELSWRLARKPQAHTIQCS